MRQALQDYRIAGIKTTVSFLFEVMSDPRFLAGDIDTTFIDAFLQKEERGEPRHRDVAVVAAAIHAYLSEGERKPASPVAGAVADSAWRLAARQQGLRRGW